VEGDHALLAPRHGLAVAAVSAILLDLLTIIVAHLLQADLLGEVLAEEYTAPAPVHGHPTKGLDALGRRQMKMKMKMIKRKER
jgi:hypothetical protein